MKCFILGWLRTLLEKLGIFVEDLGKRVVKAGDKISEYMCFHCWDDE